MARAFNLNVNQTGEGIIDTAVSGSNLPSVRGTPLVLGSPIQTVAGVVPAKESTLDIQVKTEQRRGVVETPDIGERTLQRRGLPLITIDDQRSVKREAIEENFYISYDLFSQGSDGSRVRTRKDFRFALLPAIESNLQMAPSGSVRGNASTVPEVKAGIVVKTSYRYKNIIIPGGAPVVQSVGIDNTMMNLVGCFIGTESRNSKPDLSSIYEDSSGKAVYSDLNGNLVTPATALAPIRDSVSATAEAQLFDDEIVQQGRPVTVVIQSLNQESSAVTREQLQYTGVIVNFKFFAVRRARAYYAIDLLVTEYSSVKI